MATTHVILDADPAIGVPYRDVDDGLAMLLLLASPEIELEGITINFGNVGSIRGERAAREVLQAAGVEKPVFRGAASRNDLGKSNPAVEYLIETVRGRPGEISLLAVAPLTNVATAMLLDPSFASNLKALVVMGGTFHFPIFSFFGEFNFHKDGKAASLVMQAPVPKTLITMDLCCQAVFQKRHLQRIRAADTPFARYLDDAIADWLKLNRMVFFRKKGFFPWDPVAAAYLIDPSLFDENQYRFDVTEGGIRSGRLVNSARIDPVDSDLAPAVVNVPLHLDGERFMELLVARLLSL